MPHAVDISCLFIRTDHTQAHHRSLPARARLVCQFTCPYLYTPVIPFTTNDVTHGLLPQPAAPAIIQFSTRPCIHIGRHSNHASQARTVGSLNGCLQQLHSLVDHRAVYACTHANKSSQNCVATKSTKQPSQEFCLYREVQNIQRIFTTTQRRNHSNREGEGVPTTS